MKAFVKKAIFLIIIVCLCMAVQFLIFTAFAGKEEEKAIYVGMEKCKTCHPEHVKTYSEWKYFISVEKTPHMKNIQCEACHGPASLHVKAPTVKEHLKTLSIPKNICTSCHYQHKHIGY